MHIWDVFTPVEEVVRALDDVVSAGKVLYVGISDTPAWIIAQAVTLADLRGWSRFAGLQVPYSLVERSVERELLPMAQALELTVTAWSPLGGGLLTGRYGSDRERPDDTRVAVLGQSSLTDRNLAIADVVNAVAAERGASSAQVAIAWVRAQQARAVIVPILVPAVASSWRTTWERWSWSSPPRSWPAWRRSAPHRAWVPAADSARPPGLWQYPSAD